MPYRIAGIDVHKKIAEWLLGQEVEEVAMESTAQYWKPVWEALERYWQPLRQKPEGAGRRSGTLHLAIGAQLNRSRSKHLLSFLAMLGSLDVVPNRLRADVVRCPYAIGGRPEIPSPESLAQHGEGREELACRRALANLHSLGHRGGGRDAQKQVHVVGLDFLGDHRLALCSTNIVQQACRSLGNLPREDRMPILGAKHQMVGSLQDAVPAGDHFYHVPLGTRNVREAQALFLPRLNSLVSKGQSL